MQRRHARRRQAERSVVLPSPAVLTKKVLGHYALQHCDVSLFPTLWYNAVVAFVFFFGHFFLLYLCVYI